MADAGFELETRRVGGLPLVNHFIERLRLQKLLEKYVPSDPRAKVPNSRLLGLLVRNLVLARVPIYGLCEWAAGWVPQLLGLEPDEVGLLNDDRCGRALDHLFDADRNAFLTELVVGAVKEFKIELEQLHNDSTTLTLQGEYSDATGKLVRGKPTLEVTFGHNKDHRPDLKQLVWILTISADGATPVHFKVSDGNTEDSSTHQETWDVLRRLVGSSRFLYVADSKLCTRANLRHIHEQGGQFVTVLPRSRKEDGQFRDWLQSNTPPWEEIARKPHPRIKDGPEDVYYACSSPFPESDGYRLLWYRSSHKIERDAQARSDMIEAAWKELFELKARVEGERSRFRSAASVSEAVEGILQRKGTERWISFRVEERDAPVFRQEKRGHPGKNTRYLRRLKKCFRLTWELRKDLVDYDARCDGIFPLLTDSDLGPREVLDVYRSKQPMVEKRHDLLKNVEAATPVFLKSISRIEALLFLMFVALLVSALIERQLRAAMATNSIESLPLYPEDRLCKAPTAARVLEVLEPLQRSILGTANHVVQRFEPELSRLQRQVASLLGLQRGAFMGH
jgi:transposase